MPRITVLRDLSACPQHPTFYHARHTRAALLSRLPAQLHKNLVKADVSARIDIYKGMWHVFQMSPLKNAYDAMNKIAEFIFDICR